MRLYHRAAYPAELAAIILRRHAGHLPEYLTERLYIIVAGVEHYAHQVRIAVLKPLLRSLHTHALHVFQRRIACSQLEIEPPYDYNNTCI